MMQIPNLKVFVHRCENSDSSFKSFDIFFLFPP